MTVRAEIADAVLNSSSDAIIAADREGTMTFWSPGATRIFGFSEEDAVGHGMDMIVPEALRGRHARGYRRVMETGQSRYGAGDVLSVPALTKDGRRISVAFTLEMLRDAEGGITGTVAIMRDVTKDFERMRRLRQALEGAGGDVTHEGRFVRTTELKTV